MITPQETNWLVIQAKDSNYGDIAGQCYEYSGHIQNAHRVKPGDVLLLALPRRDAPDNKRVFGIARIGVIRTIPDGHYIAYYDRYSSFEPVMSFEQIGGDPRRNPRMSINKINATVVEQILANIGLSTVGELPSVSIGPELLETPPEHELRNLFHEAVADDLL